MSATATPAAPITADEDAVHALATDLRNAGLTVDALDALWGEDAAGGLFRGTRAPALRALDARRERDGVTPLATLARLFVLGLPVDRVDATAAFPSVGIRALVDTGLVGIAGDTVVPAVDLRPYAFVDDAGAGSWWIVSDLGEMVVGGALYEEHVLGIGGASTTLSGLLLPVHVERALDLGTGCGVQAMHARRFADTVVATDISPRALDIARFNALLNGVDGIEFRLGSLFEPVAGERFDRIVSNPPFVITPRRDDVPMYEYRDGGLVGDALVETVLRGLAAHLRPGGTAQLLGNWEYRWGRDGLDRLRGWFGGGGTGGGTGAGDAALDVWVVERECQDPVRYAETWVRDGGTRTGTPEFDRLVTAWLEDFAARTVTGVGFGYVFARRPSDGGGLPFRRFERVPETLGTNPAGLGATVARCLDAVEWLRTTDDDALGRARLAVAGDVTEERHYWPGNDDPTVITLVQGGGLGRRVGADTALAAFVGACDGELSVRAIIDAIAELTGLDAESLAADLVPRIRDLVIDGMLRPVPA